MHVHVEGTFGLRCFLLTQHSAPTYTLTLSYFPFLTLNTCFAQPLSCLPVSPLVCIVYTGNYHASASDHSDFLFIFSPKPAPLFPRTYFSIFLGRRFIIICVIAIVYLHQANLRGQVIFSPSLSSQSPSKPTPSPKCNITLYPSDKNIFIRPRTISSSPWCLPLPLLSLPPLVLYLPSHSSSVKKINHGSQATATEVKQSLSNFFLP